ncbi:MAG: calcium-binding protein [Planctomycetes bacterium]|nr:calcium-binding protein [Planctomycetota bacterium]
MSADGRFVAFMSPAADIVPGDTNGAWDVFVRDRLNRTTERVSVSSSGGQANAHSGRWGLAMSRDARFVVFQTDSTNLVTGGTNGAWHIILRDRLNGTTELVSVDSNGVQGKRWLLPSRRHGRRALLAFSSLASNLVPGDTNNTADIFVHDRVTGATERISVSSGGSQSNGTSEVPSISGDGRYVSFDSTATTLVAGDTNAHNDVFLRDRLSGTTEVISFDSNGTQANADSTESMVSLDGSCVVFLSSASNLVPNDTNGTWDVFVRVRPSGTTERISVSNTGLQGTVTAIYPAITPDGRFIAFRGAFSVPAPVSGIWIRDRQLGTTEYASYCYDGSIPAQGADVPSISPDARYIVFRSTSPDLVPNDTNANTDVFLYDRYASSFTSICDPLDAAVLDCPCNNPPASPGRGCDNSSATGGAMLAASGVASLSADTLAFSTTGEKPNATSILLEGDSVLATGAPFGQGVRCVGGTLRRLYTKTAHNGAVLVPDLAASDPTVSARCAQLGVAITLGETRVFLVYYRDPLVLGGCGATSTYNATQSGTVVYAP